MRRFYTLSDQKVTVTNYHSRGRCCRVSNTSRSTARGCYTIGLSTPPHDLLTNTTTCHSERPTMPSYCHIPFASMTSRICPPHQLPLRPPLQPDHIRQKICRKRRVCTCLLTPIPTTWQASMHARSDNGSFALPMRRRCYSATRCTMNVHCGTRS